MTRENRWFVLFVWFLSCLVEPEQPEEPNKPDQHVSLGDPASWGMDDGEADRDGDIRPGVENL